MTLFEMLPELSQETSTPKRTRGTNPCEICRKLRKKCAPYESDGDQCERCWMLKLKCVYEEEALPANPEVDIYHDLLDIEYQMDGLEKEMEKVRGERTARFEMKDGLQASTLELIRSPSASSISDATVHTLLPYTNSQNDAFDVVLGTLNKLDYLPVDSFAHSQLVLANQPLDDFSVFAAIVKGNNAQRAAQPLGKRRRQSKSTLKHDEQPSYTLRPWTVLLTRTGLRIDTTIRTINDLVDFTLHSLESIQGNSTRPFLMPPQTDRRVLLATPLYPVVTLETHIRSYVKLALDEWVSLTKRTKKDIPLITDSVWLYKKTISLATVDNLIYNIAACPEFRVPFLHEPSFFRRYEKMKSDGIDPLSWHLVCAICATLSIGKCKHIKATDKDVIAREQLGASFFVRAEAMIRDRFDEPDTDTAAAMLFLALYCMIVGNISPAFTFIEHAETMCHALAANYWEEMETSEIIEVDDMKIIAVPEDPAEADALISRQVFKRIYVVSIFFSMLKKSIFTSSIQQNTFPFPAISKPFMALSDEGPEVRRVLRFFQSVFDVDLMRNDEAFGDVRKIYNGQSTEIDLETCNRIEQRLNYWYNSLPSDLKITEESFQIIDAQWLLDTKPDRYKVSLATIFHLCWIHLHRHFLPPISRAASSTTAPSSMLPLFLRSLTICTQSAAIITRLAEYSYIYKSCHFDPHPLMEACDINYRLSTSSDPRLAALGRRHFESGIEIMRKMFLDDESSALWARTCADGLEQGIRKLATT
ncbi:hypothetical protein BC936DRAFT_150172 [Jimgerdemannia flammicorona]|uniref:Zn(2)-C6 fungal-type domain-containing protein n=1 Tax=Jimgerdemannia flammicorona TaxID=994334 RepID=A0A433DJJ5_9FUNG|nr:hypothetical protein BC936DRAFT_150172 [Jimgerdemannia flammicorona]